SRQREGCVNLQHSPRRTMGVDLQRAVAAGRRPTAGRDKIVDLECERAALLHTTRPVERVKRLGSTEGCEVAAVALFHLALRFASARLQLLRRILVDAKVHTEVRLFDVVPALLDGDPR